MMILKTIISILLCLVYAAFCVFIDNMKPEPEFGKIEYYNELMIIYHYSPILIVAVLMLVWRKQVKSFLN